MVTTLLQQRLWPMVTTVSVAVLDTATYAHVVAAAPLKAGAGACPDATV